MSMKDAETVIREARATTGRAYRSIGRAMGQMHLSQARDQNALRYAVAQLNAAATSLRPLVLDPAPNAIASDVAEWYFVDYSRPKSHECPTGRGSIRLRALSEYDAIQRAATLLDEQGLGLTARLNHARRDDV